MRKEVIELGKMGALPPFQSILDNPEGEALLKKYEELITSIQPPITNDEARVLVGVLGPGDCFGVEWALIHLIETAPGWPLEDCLVDADSQGVAFLKQRAKTPGAWARFVNGSFGGGFAPPGWSGTSPHRRYAANSGFGAAAAQPAGLSVWLIK
jgi:hypothetical protein